SFGPLRHHVLESGFGDDIEKFLVASGLPPAQFELRIAERTYITCPSAVWERLAAMGVSLVIDECGRLHASLERMARSPLSGLQLDRSWVAKLPDPSAAKVCRAMIGLAHAFDLVPIAMGVDDEAKRLALLGLGCGQGSGDLFQGGAALRARVLGATGVI
ncbi:MAG: EAL domain-containing protein, partial [Proteobacteria bacterium]